jgi:hypothetical protein
MHSDLTRPREPRLFGIATTCSDLPNPKRGHTVKSGRRALCLSGGQAHINDIDMKE